VFTVLTSELHFNLQICSCYRRVPAEFFPADIQLTFRLAIYFSVDNLRTEIWQLVQIRLGL